MTGLFNVSEWHSIQSPKPGHYNAVDMDKIKSRSPNYSQRSKVDRFKSFDKTNAPSPLSYKPDDLATSTARQKTPALSIPKDKLVNFMQRHIKNKSYVPSSASYELSQGLDKLSKGPNFKGGRYR